MMEAYSARLYLLQRGLQRAGGITFFPRLKVVTVPDKEKPQPNTSDPGFGVGWFSWPEIDRPTPRHAAWNAAVQKEAAGMTLDPDDPRQPLADFDASSAAGADVSVAYTLKAANERFISIDLANGTYHYGAAHPIASTISFEWWVERGRALRAEDVFRPGSGWETFLERRCYEELTTGGHAKDVYADQVSRESLAEPARQVKSWTLTARNFAVSFDENSVPAREAGPVEIALRWDELKPYLATGFDPAILPQPIEQKVR